MSEQHQLLLPVRPEDVRIVPGNSGKGLQVTCSCGCVNWNHVEIREARWQCRNCRRILSYNFPGLVEKVLAKTETPASSSA